MFHVLKLINSISIVKSLNKKFNIFQISFNEMKFVQYIYLYKSNYTQLKIKISDVRSSNVFIKKWVVVLSAVFVYIEIILFILNKC